MNRIAAFGIFLFVLLLMVLQSEVLDSLRISFSSFLNGKLHPSIPLDTPNLDGNGNDADKSASPARSLTASAAMMTQYEEPNLKE